MAVHVETFMDHMSDVPVLSGPVSYVFADDNPPNPPAPHIGLPEWQRWAYENGGHDAQCSVIQVTLQGLSTDPVSIEPPNLIHHETTPVTNEKTFGPGGLGGGGILPRNYQFTLKGTSVTRTFDPADERPQAFQLTAGETERLTILVQADDELRHTWSINVPYIRAGKRSVLEVARPAGQPFVTHGGQRLTKWLSNGSGWTKTLDEG